MLGAKAWPEVPDGGLLAVPLGATEQHGPHLPLDTDTRIAVALAEGLVSRRADVLIAPALPYGSSGEHAAFAGTLSIGQQALELVLVELVRSAWFAAGVVLVCWHGGNAEPLERATALLDRERRRILPWLPTIRGGDAHAGRTETSLMLALAPEAVRRRRAKPGNTHPLPTIAADLRREGVRAVSPNGVLGDPAGAAAEEGRRLLDTLVDDLASAVTAWVT
jgi:mycofactocin system creatininase family protein